VKQISAYFTCVFCVCFVPDRFAAEGSEVCEVRPAGLYVFWLPSFLLLLPCLPLTMDWEQQSLRHFCQAQAQPLHPECLHHVSLLIPLVMQVFHRCSMSATLVRLQI